MVKTAPEVRTTGFSLALSPVPDTLPEMPLRLEQFGFFDKNSGASRTRRNLPHWEQSGVCAFVTFRMADALPQGVIDAWVLERDGWLWAHGIDTAEQNWRAALDALPEETVNEFHRTFTRRMHELLDAGHGSCFLRRKELRRVVEDTLGYWQGERCLLAGWVIMPNHVHVLVQPAPGHGLRELCESWKRYSATRIIRMLSRSGQLWQAESWDHLLRHAGYLAKYRRYLKRNPVKARLPETDYTLWLPEIEGLGEE